MTITGILGEIGSGKSLELLAYSCELANSKQKRLVFNFAVDLKALRKYASMMGYGWLGFLIDTNQVVCLQLSDHKQLLQIFSRKSTVVAVDEAQIFFNSRNFRNTPSNVLADLCLSRHDGVDVIWCAQVDTHVDVQFRQLTQYFIHANGMSKYDKTLRNERLLLKMYFYFRGSTYELWLGDLKARRLNIMGFIKTWFNYAKKIRIAPINEKDIQLFKAFSSFNRLDKITSEIQTPVYKFEFQQVSFNNVLADNTDNFELSPTLHVTKELHESIAVTPKQKTDPNSNKIKNIAYFEL